MDVLHTTRASMMNKEQLEMYDKLTTLQKSVALAKVADPTLNDTDAYIAGGGKARNADSVRASAYDILTNPSVVGFIDSFKEAVVSSKIMSREQMMEDLSIIANASMFDICDLLHADDELMNVGTGEMFTGTESFTLKRASDIKPEHHKLIRSMKMGRYGIEVTLIDPMQARKMLADMQGFNAPIKTETQINGEIGLKDISNDDLADELSSMGISVD